MKNYVISFCIFCALLTTVNVCEGSEEARKIDNGSYIIYLPEGINESAKYPLVVALSPSANAESMLRPWQAVADKYKWIILSSRQHKNGMDFKEIGNIFSNTIRNVILSYPVDERKVVATGFSGGGMSSHYLSMAYPKLIRAVVINTGMISEHYATGKSYYYPKNKLAVFLASPSDFRYQEMRRDNSFLKNNGWQTEWIEFEGGHTIAPESVYLRAAQWLNERL